MIEITSRELTEFLNQLARCYRHAGRLYLVGGSSLILVSSKVSTLDVDLKIETSPASQMVLATASGRVRAEQDSKNPALSPTDMSGLMCVSKFASVPPLALPNNQT